jgi:hypothetical protein
MGKMIIFLEKMWLMVAIVCLILAAYKSMVIGYEDGAYFLMFSLLAAALFLLRRRMRIRMQKQQKQDK